MVSETEYLIAYGHENVIGTHRSTFEITKSRTLTKAGNCIIAVDADKGISDLSYSFCDLLKTQGARLITKLICRDTEVTIHATGSPFLELNNPHDYVWRRSGYTCGRTIGIFADHTAETLPRRLIHQLQTGAELDVEMMVIAKEPQSSSSSL